MTRPRLGRTLSGAAAALALSVGVPAIAADHRDAPTIDDYSAIDINDVYMFRNPTNCAPGPGCKLVMVLSTQAVADPSFGPSYHFQENALYRLNFSTTPEAISKGKATASIDFVFSAFESSPSCPSAAPCQTYRAMFPNGLHVDGLVTEGTAAAVPKALEIKQVSTADGTISIFAGPREDPFFFDLVGFNRFIGNFNAQTPTPPALAVPNFKLFTGKDAFLGKNINAIVLELPFKVLLPNPNSTKLAAWAVTYLGDLPADDGKHDHGRHLGRPGDDLRQVDRMGNPGVNTVLIRTPLKDAFNFAEPRDDATIFAPEIAGNLTRYGVDPGVLSVLATAAIPDTLKFDTTKPDGYLAVPPNGRRLADRTTDFLLTLFFNVQGTPGTQRPGSVSSANCGVAQTAFSDCTAPKQYLLAFPFVGPPLQPTP